MVISLSKLYPFLSSSILFSVFISVLCRFSYHTGHLNSPLRFYEFVVSVNFPWESSTQNCQTSVFHYSIPVCFLISPVIYSSLFPYYYITCFIDVLLLLLVVFLLRSLFNLICSTWLVFLYFLLYYISLTSLVCYLRFPDSSFRLSSMAVQCVQQNILYTLPYIFSTFFRFSHCLKFSSSGFYIFTTVTIFFPNFTSIFSQMSCSSTWVLSGCQL